MKPSLKPLVWNKSKVKSPPFTLAGRIETGSLLRRLQEGENLTLPHSRPLPSLGANVHELRVRDAGNNWRIVYRIDTDYIVIANVFAKKGDAQQKKDFDKAKRRLAKYDHDRTGV